MSWGDVQRVLEEQNTKLANLLNDIGSGKATDVVDGDAALEMILGLSCHSAYHAGQIQLNQGVGQAVVAGVVVYIDA
jgi:hypothetical protein